MLAGSCTHPYHHYKAGLVPINGLIMPTLDADGWIWPIFAGNEKCDCKVMLCASRCLVHIGSVMWLDKLFKHLSNPTFQAGFCFHSTAVDLAGSQQPCSRLTLFACLTERTFWLCRPPVPFCKGDLTTKLFLKQFGLLKYSETGSMKWNAFYHAMAHSFTKLQKHSKNISQCYSRGRKKW